MQCPAACSGKQANRQHDLSPAQLDKLPAKAQEVVSDAGGGFRCNYCGCVYVRQGDHARKLGFLDDAILGPGWHSRTYL
uniref:hypothetical protein n=1 Tax=Cupriavidus gilardii TaxID=82541 RepID=UPI00247AA0EF|nr:hypothetical protein [Cupriavidus gilardii]